MTTKLDGITTADRVWLVGTAGEWVFPGELCLILHPKTRRWVRATLLRVDQSSQYGAAEYIVQKTNELVIVSKYKVRKLGSKSRGIP